MADGRRGWALGGLLVVGLLGAACGSDGDDAAGASGARLRVVTTVSPITNIVANVVGDLADIDGIVPEGTNSHTFEPPASAAKVLAQADVVFINGLKLEEPTKDLADGTLKDGTEIVELGTATIEPGQYIYDFSFPEEGGKPNPHLWTDPPYAKEYARIVKDKVAALDPGHATAYAANFERFAARVDQLDGAIRAATASVPRPDLLTYHDAYAYFARRYGWTVIGAIQVSDFDDPTPKDVAGLIRQVREAKVPAIFGSEVFPSPVLAQIGRETRARYVDRLRDDDLPGRPGDPDHSWLGLMVFDYTTMVTALGGDPSPLQAVEVGNVAPDRARYPQ